MLGNSTGPPPVGQEELEPTMLMMVLIRSRISIGAVYLVLRAPRDLQPTNSRTDRSVPADAVEGCPAETRP